MRSGPSAGPRGKCAGPAGNVCAHICRGGGRWRRAGPPPAAGPAVPLPPPRARHATRDGWRVPPGGGGLALFVRGPRAGEGAPEAAAAARTRQILIAPRRSANSSPRQVAARSPGRPCCGQLSLTRGTTMDRHTGLITAGYVDRA